MAAWPEKLLVPIGVSMSTWVLPYVKEFRAHLKFSGFSFLLISNLKSWEVPRSEKFPNFVDDVDQDDVEVMFWQ